MPSRSQAVTALLILAAIALFALRGPVRFSQHPPQEPTDLLLPYLASKAWVRGLNPYASGVYWDLKAEAGWEVSDRDRVDGFESRTAYPLTALVLLSPLAPLPWQMTRVVANVFVSLLVVVAIAALSSIPDFRRSARRRAFFVALALALAPVHSSIGTGNLAAAAVSFIGLAVWATRVEKHAMAGVAVGLAICLKPPLGLPLLGYYVLRRWTSATIGIASVAAIGAVGVLRLYVARVSWFEDYLQNNQMLVGDQGIAMIEHSGAQRQFINLQFLGYELFGNASMASGIAISIGALLALTWLALLFRGTRYEGELLAISSLSVISLLPVYHRVYDAGLLLLPLCWAIAEWPSRAMWLRVATLTLMLPFLIPAATFLDMQSDAGRIPASLSSQWWWSTLVSPHQVWSLLGLAVVLLVAQASTTKPQPAMV